MQNPKRASRRLGRHTHLALALGLALGMNASAAVAAQQQSIAANNAAISNKTDLPSAQVNGPPLPGIATTPFRANESGKLTMAATIPVSNCLDSGTGSLRTAIAGASSGDTIDMSGLSCNLIPLQSTLKIYQHDLTIRGRQSSTSSLSPRPTLSGQNNVRVIEHHSSGDLRLESVGVADGYESTSAGIWSSNGTIFLQDSLVRDSAASCTSGCSLVGSQHGAISAREVTLNDSAVRDNTAIYDVLGYGGIASVKGGGIYSSANTNLVGSTVSGNVAHALGGTSKGGGIFAGGALTIITGTLTGNEAIESSGQGEGGGAYMTQASTLNSPEVSANKGGGLHMAGGGTIKYGVIVDNSEARTGGGIRAGADIEIKNSTIAGNHAIAYGGGLYATANADIKNSTLSGNEARHAAGAYISGGGGAPIVLKQSTISGNVATDSTRGAGLFIGYDAIIKNSTITNNVESNSGNQRHGAGISVADGMQADLSSTIVSGNLLERSNNSLEDSNIGIASTGSTATVVGSHNLIGDSTLALPTGTLTENDPKLASLDDNGGPTSTHRPLNGSPVIDAGVANGEQWDQRGTGFSRIAGAAADIGAVEPDRIFANGFEWQPHNWRFPD